MKSNTAQKNIPQGWRNVPLASLAVKIRTGGTPKSTNKSFYNGGIPFVKIDDMTSSGKYLSSTMNFISEEGFKKSSAWLVPSGSILYSIYATVGEVSISSMEVATNQAIMGIVVDHEKVDRDYLYQYLLSIKPTLKKHFKETTQKNLTSQIVKELEILVPESKTEQQKIAEILGAVDEDIAKTQGVIEAAEKLKKGLMQQLFTRGIGHTKFKKTKLGEIPEEWKVGKIDDHAVHVGSGATPRGGSKVYLAEGVPFIRSQNVYFSGFTQEGLVYISEKTHRDMNRSKVLPNDILLNITGASIGRACIVPNDFATANVNQHVCIIRPAKDLFFQYLFYFLQSQNGQDQIFKFQIGGNREGLNFQQIRSIEFPFPKNIEEQKEITEILLAVDEKISINKKLKNKLTLLKKGLMQDLLSGKVRVK